MGFNPISLITKRFRKESRDAGKAVGKESEALKLEVQEERIETEVQREVRNFSVSWREEVAFLKDLAAMQSSKYTLVKAFNAIGAAKRNLSYAKKGFLAVLLGEARIYKRL